METSGYVAEPILVQAYVLMNIGVKGVAEMPANGILICHEQFELAFEKVYQHVFWDGYE
jgi:hypothetical protein